MCVYPLGRAEHVFVGSPCILWVVLSAYPLGRGDVVHVKLTCDFHSGDQRLALNKTNANFLGKLSGVSWRFE